VVQLIVHTTGRLCKCIFQLCAPNAQAELRGIKIFRRAAVSSSLWLAAEPGRRRSSNLLRAVAGRDSPRREKAGDPVAAAGEGSVEEARQGAGAGEPEEDGGPPVPPRATQDRATTALGSLSRPNSGYSSSASQLGSKSETSDFG